MLTFTNLYSDEFDYKVEEFILNNPEIILQSLKNYEKKKNDEAQVDLKRKIAKNREKIFESYSPQYSGKKLGKKIIVEFFDYNCSYCKKAHEDIEKLLENYKDLKVIYKNFPILSEKSVELAKLSILVAEQDNEKFNKFHKKLLNIKGMITDSKLEKISNEINLDLISLKEKISNKNVNEKLSQDFELAKELGLKGTPVFIIDDEIFMGFVGYDALSSKFSE